MTQIREIPLSQLVLYPNQTSKEHANDYIEQLAEDIRQNGIRKELIVRPVGDMFQVVCGLARWKGAILAPLSTVPADVRRLTDEEAAELAMQDNLHTIEFFNPHAHASEADISDAELQAAIDQSRVRLAEKTIEGTPTFTLREPLPAELCTLFKNDFVRDEIIQGVLELTPKAGLELSNEYFDRFARGLDAGELHIEGHIFGVNESLLCYIAAYVEDDMVKDTFRAGQWESMTADRKAEVLSAANRIDSKIKQIVFG